MAEISYQPVIVADTLTQLNQIEKVDSGTLAVVWTGGAGTLYIYNGTDFVAFVPA